LLRLRVRAEFPPLLEGLPGVIERPSMQGWSEGRVLARQDWAPGLFSLTVDARTEPFLPGQFVNLALEIEGVIERRSYSIASPPGSPLEFLFAAVPGGRLTPALLRLAPGDPILVEPKPQGFFTLRWVPEAPELWLLATGTGLGPFLSILRSGVLWERFESVVLAHGVRDRAHLAHRSELLELSRTQPKFRLVALVSREPEAPDALQGRVTTALVQGSLERAAGLAITPERSHLMLCGNPAMIDEMIERLAERGLRKHRVRAPGHITIEKYW
jgi:ferredoxin--NADP+ reductase